MLEALSASIPLPGIRRCHESHTAAPNNTAAWTAVVDGSGRGIDAWKSWEDTVATANSAPWVSPGTAPRRR